MGVTVARLTAGVKCATLRRVNVVGLVSSYHEAQLGRSAVRSLLPACDSVLVAEGPIGDQPASQEDWREFGRQQRVTVLYGEWADDAAKRTHLLLRAKQRGAKWGIVLDADEILVWGEYLRDVIAYLEAQEEATGEIQMGASLRLVELDGSCAAVGNRILRLDYIDHYSLSSFHFLLTNGVEVSRPNIPLLESGEPDDEAREGVYLQRRRPLAGEPHILHRSGLRTRQGERMHMAEAAEMAVLMGEMGLTPHEAPVRSGGVEIWLPE